MNTESHRWYKLTIYAILLFIILLITGFTLSDNYYLENDIIYHEIEVQSYIDISVSEYINMRLPEKEIYIESEPSIEYFEIEIITEEFIESEESVEEFIYKYLIHTNTAETTTEQVNEWVSLGEFKLTAYCLCVKCCGIWSMYHPSRIGTDYIQMTVSGTIPTPGRTVGVNPSVIPYGTEIMINGIIYIAEDTGSAAQQNSKLIDVCMSSHNEAVKFGIQKTEVFIK